MLLTIIDQNDNMCFEANKDISQKIFAKLKRSKYLNFEQMDIVNEFNHIL